MLEDIEDSLPPLRPGDLSAAQRELWERLPEEYRDFLRAHNGGTVPAFRYAFKTGVPHRTAAWEKPSRTDAPVEFFGLGTGNEGDQDGVRDLAEVAAEHAAEEFLPRDVVAIASCMQNSLVCLSLRPDSHGRVFYWDWYWRYPWSKHFFDARLDAVQARYPDAESVLSNREHPQYWEVSDAFNFATVVELAPSLGAWLASCEDAREDES